MSQQLINYLNHNQIPFQQLSTTKFIIDPQTSPQYDFLPQTNTIYLRDQPYIYLDLSITNINTILPQLN